MSDFLKCDAVGCGHLEYCEDYGPELIGRPCPKCGENLLTQKDFDDYEPIRIAHQILKDAGLVIDATDDSDGNVRLIVGVHDGKTTIEIGGE